MILGDTFVFKAEDGDPHLWIVITDPKAHPDDVWVVNASTLRQGQDQEFVLNAGDHPMIVHASVLRFDKASKVSLQGLIKALSDDEIEMRMPLDMALVVQIQKAARVSESIKIGCKKTLDEQGVEP